MDIVLASARADLRFSMEVLLREQPGVVVTGTATGSEGLLALIETTSPILAILDWDLPGRAIEDVLARAQAADRRPYIIVLGKDAPTERIALAAGADDFVLYGDSPQYLLDAVQQARSQAVTAAERETLSSVRRATAENQTLTEMKGE
jgi:DNA-binding NarL/FixJ family response regulator